MEFRNEEKTSFRHLTPDQRSLIVEADYGFGVFVCTEKASFVKVKQDSK